VPFTDDEAVASRVVEAVRSARSHPDAVIFLAAVSTRAPLSTR